MERTKRNPEGTWYAACVLFMMVSCNGCGTPMIYHFKHYHRPFAAISQSNKTYFHSSQTGRIIPNNEGATYCGPDCFGYDPTSWTRWPSECPANCPVQREVISDVVGEAVISDADPANRSYEHLKTAPLQVRPAPANQVPSIPADIGLSVPSPLDATQHQQSPMATEPAPEPSLGAEVEEKVEATKFAKTRSETELNKFTARKVIPPKKKTQRGEVKPLEVDVWAAEKPKSALALRPIKVRPKPSKVQSTPIEPDSAPKKLKETNSIAIKSVSEVDLPSNKKAEPKRVTEKIATKRMPKVFENVTALSPSVKMEAKELKKDKDIAMINVSNPKNTSQLRFVTKPTRRLDRISAVVDQKTSIRFR